MAHDTGSDAAAAAKVPTLSIHFVPAPDYRPVLSLPLRDLPAGQRPTALYAAALTHALARDEAAGRRPVRLTEAGLATWSRFKGRLASADLLRILFEDAAVLHPVPFDPAALRGGLSLERLADGLADEWLASIANLDLAASPADYVTAQAKLLGVTTRLARAELHVVKRHQRVLELPGTGGQLMHHLVTSCEGLSPQVNFTVACGSWQEQTLAGLIGVELGAPHTDCAVRAEAAQLRNDQHPVRRASFDFVVGQHPEKGGLFRVEDQLALWFPNARIVLV